MEGKSIMSLLIVLVFIAYLVPVGMNAMSESLDTADDETYELANYTSLSDADKANYTSIYAEDGEPPTPWSTATKVLFGIIGLIIMTVLFGMIAPD